MQIKTADGERNVASNALGVWGAVGGGLGTLALVTQGLFRGGNILGLNGNNGETCNQITKDTRYISALESEISTLKSEKYTDSVGIDLYKQIVAKSNAEDEKINANYKELAQFIAALDKDVAVYKQATTDNLAYLDKKIDCESQKLRCYVDGTFVPGKLVMPLSSICPPAQPATTTPTATKE